MKTKTHQNQESENAVSRAASGFSQATPQKNFAILPKLEVGKPGDEYEQEADRTADQVMQTADNAAIQRATLPEEKIQKETLPEEKIQKKSISGEYASWIQRTSREEDDEDIQMKPLNPSQRDAPDISWLENQISQSRNGGQPLPAEPRSFMESRFGADFSQVNIHTGQQAEHLSRSISAQAFTHKNDIYFNEGKFEPETRQGKHLLAHELTHVVQQTKGIQRMATIPVKNNINFTDEILDIPFSQDDKEQNELLEDVDGYSSSLTKEEESVLNLQRTPDVIRRDDDVPKPARKDLVFLMGTKGGFYSAAKGFFKTNHPEAEIVSFKDRSLAGIFSVLRKNISDEKPAGNIYIVSHANADGTLSFPLNSKDKDQQISFGELKNALLNNADMFALSGGIDEQTSVHIKGCNIGRNTDMLNQLDEAFGGKVNVDAPTHKQGYKSQTKKVDGKTQKTATEFFNTLILEYPGDTVMNTEALINAFKEKYSDLDYKDHEWRMMVIGAKAYNKDLTSEAKDKKKEIDKLAKEKKKLIDKKDKDALQEVDSETSDQKKEVDDWAKSLKETEVASKSPGAKREVVSKFTATVYNNVDPKMEKKDAMKFGKKWFKKGLPKGFVLKECTSITPNATEPLQTDFEFLSVNKKTDETYISVYTTPKLPTTDEETVEIANEIMEKEVEKKPGLEVARRDMYSWRIVSEKKKKNIKITAYLEMTVYSIDVNLKEKTGETIDPATKAGEGFYYGESDYE